MNQSVKFINKYTHAHAHTHSVNLNRILKSEGATEYMLINKVTHQSITNSQKQIDELHNVTW